MGSGGAGLRAALEARRKGVDVILACKGKIGRSGNTPLSGAAMSVVLTEQDSIDTHIKDTLRSGNYINDANLVRILVHKGPRSVKQLKDYGVDLRDPKERITHRPGHTYPRSLLCDYSEFHPRVRGLALTHPLTEECEEQGVQFLENVTIINLSKKGNRVCGAQGVTKDGSEIMISAAAIVLATGGGGQIYLRNDNSSHATGDGYILALEAGARLIDMEFVQFHPSFCHDPANILVSSSLFGEGATLVNSSGEQFMNKYHKRGDMAPRDVKSQAIYGEIMNGKGVNNGVYMDLSPIQNSILETEYSYLLEVFEKHGIDLRKEPIIVAPTCHFFMGGIEIDTTCYTGIPGLFAVGETVGGIHGANRLAGNSLTETQVFGKIAGMNAAKCSKNTPKDYWNQEISSKENCSSKKTLNDSTKIDEMKLELKELMWKNASLSRSKTALTKTASQLDSLIDELDYGDLANESNSRSLFEWKSMLKTSKAVVISALKRKETRGAHMRVDYPNQSEEWKCHLVISGNFAITKRK